jgi:hypothetical protein
MIQKELPWMAIQSFFEEKYPIAKSWNYYIGLMLTQKTGLP